MYLSRFFSVSKVLKDLLIINIMSEIKTKKRMNDPEYHKQYYENKLKNQNFICDVCKCELNITNKSRHLKTKKHMKLCNGVSNTEKFFLKN